MSDEEPWECPNCNREFGNETARRETPDGPECFMCSNYGRITP